MSQSSLIGRRAVYTQRITKWDNEKREYILEETRTFKGEIVWVGVGGSSSYCRVMMLYDDGSLRQHEIENITVEAKQAEGPYR